jgi:Arm DNA-binding domain
MPKLTAKTVAAAKLPAGKTDAIIFCSEMPGFGLRLRCSGDQVRRSWIIQYRRAGATRRFLLGSAEVLSAEQARAAAKKMLATVALGEDPQADKAERRAKDSHTLRALVAEYLAAKKGTVRPRTHGALAAYLTGSYFKPLHAMPVDTVTRKDVAARLVAITREHGSIRCGTGTRRAQHVLRLGNGQRAGRTQSRGWHSQAKGCRGEGEGAR